MDERAFIQLEVRDFGGDSVCFQYILHVFSIRTFVGLYGSNTYVSVPFKFFSMRISSSQELLGFRSAAVRFRVSVHRIIVHNII
jgi:hypothetical protein